MTCSINDCSVTTNGDTLQEQILLTNTRDTQRIRTTPSKFDQYAWTLDDAQSSNGNMSTLNFQRPAVGEVPTGAWPITFYNPRDGTRLVDDANNVGAYLDPSTNAPVYYMNGRPIVIPGGILKGLVATMTAGTTISVTPDTGTLGTGTALITWSAAGKGQALGQVLDVGSSFTITGLTAAGGQSIWNGYYVVSSLVQDNTGNVTLQFRYGQVAYSSGGASAFTSRGGTTVTQQFYITAAALPSADSNLYSRPVTSASKLLGQILPSGIQIMPTPQNLPMTVSFLYQVAEPIVMSPFIYQDALEFNNVGLYGCTNIQFTMNIQTPSPNCQTIQQGGWPSNYAPFSAVRTNCDYPAGGTVIRSCGSVGAFSNVTLTAPVNIPTTTGAFYNPRMVVQFLTPGPDVSLPLISNVPYMEFPRYTNSYLISDSRAAQLSIQSQTITLSSIPDFIMVYAKPRTRCQLQNETYVPIQRVAVTFDNFSNLCSNMTQYELYTCSVAAGLDMDYQTWRGFANASGQRLTNGTVQTGSTSGASSVFGYLTALANNTGNTLITVSYNPSTFGNVVQNNQVVVFSGLTGVASGLNGTFVATNVNANQFTVPSPTSGTAFFAGQVTGVISTVGGSTGVPPQSYLASVSTGAWNLGGSKVPYELSAGTGNLWPIQSGAFNIAGQNKLAPRSTTQLTGGPLMLRMGQDVSLSPGLAPGTLGNFSIQLNLTLDNSQHFFDAYSSYQLTIIAVNSGYFETVRGQSAVRKTILNMADVESASVATGVTTSQLRRLVGGARGGSLSSMGMHMSKHPYSSAMEGGAHKRRHMGGSGL
jgi:hypothetical protein